NSSLQARLPSPLILKKPSPAHFWRIRTMRLVCLALLLSLNAVLALSQAQTQAPGNNRARGENIVGKVTSVSKDFLTVAPLTGGEPVTIKIGANTRVTKQRQPIKLDEIKVDDIVFTRGQINGNDVEAAMISVIPPDMVQRFQQGGMGGVPLNREDLGKKFIAGEV